MNTLAIDDRRLTKRDTAISIFLIGLMFFIFGFVSWGQFYPDSVFQNRLRTH